MADDGDQAVRSTSDWMAEVRLRESKRDDAYLVDPYADLLAGDSASTVDTVTELGGPAEVIITRGRFGDAMVLDAVREGVDQVAILASGSDTRAFRLGLPSSVTVYELDLPGQLGSKFAAMAKAGAHPSAQLVMVEADLRDDWTSTLTEVGLLPGKPTAWLIEGLFYYIEARYADSLMKRLSDMSAPGSRLALDVPHSRYFTTPANARFLAYMSERGSPFVFGLTDPVAWLASHGWQAQAYLSTDLVAGHAPLLPPAPERLSNPDRPIWHVAARRAAR